MKKTSLINWVIIAAVIILAAIILVPRDSEPQTDEEVAKCIGENSVLYVQLGCHACESQEEMFGEYYKHLNVVDCFYDRETCSKIPIGATPTWIINGQVYKEVQSIEKLRELTGC